MEVSDFFKLCPISVLKLISSFQTHCSLEDSTASSMSLHIPWNDLWWWRCKHFSEMTVPQHVHHLFHFFFFPISFVYTVFSLQIQYFSFRLCSFSSILSFQHFLNDLDLHICYWMDFEWLLVWLLYSSTITVGSPAFTNGISSWSKNTNTQILLHQTKFGQLLLYEEKINGINFMVKNRDEEEVMSNILHDNM